MRLSHFYATVAVSALVVTGVLVAFLPPVPPASAETHAARICREAGVLPGGDGYEYCMAATVRSIEWGKPALGRALARMTVEARESCRNEGVRPGTPAFKACLEKETQARSLLIYADEQPTYGPQVAGQ
ncbi:hypothetical protein [Reyranella sp.]|uniref:hypothetical protein n=1 Tax=Reyranella sp. TaxID=1929291 RepID=UPI003BAB86F0